MTKEELKEKAKIVIPIDLAKMEGKVYYKFTCSDLEEYTNQAIAEHEEKNPYDLIVDWLCSDIITIRILEMAYRESIRRNAKIPEGAKNLLVQPNGMGLIQFAQHFGNIVGKMELSYRRGIQEGIEIGNQPTEKGGEE